MSNPQDRLNEPTLSTRGLQPENKETPISFLNTDIVPSHLFFKRNHFSYPKLTYSNYWLPINGLVKTPKIFSLQEIVKLPSKTIKVILECAGNKRSLFEPKVFGEQWEKGAISQGYWTGVSLTTLLEATGINPKAKEVLIEGYDKGKRTDKNNEYSYSRSLPLDKALDPDTIIAYEYNSQPIPFKHGYPLRLIVPNWYGMASVKWIKQISLISSEFKGPYQSIDYVYYPNKENDTDSFPVTIMNVNSTIQEPVHMEILNTGTHVIKGIAWTGAGEVSKVEVSTDHGDTWLEAEIEPTYRSYGWVSWTYEWSVYDPGEYTIMSKSTDTLGRTQPLKPFWNRKGYGYNAIDKVEVKIE
ncbi:sulfite oxidase [Halalkalibacter alkaliphilus]|uniref:Sulfite oxidase n=1 Tax=Halalkalibacter alkaliphilus TaxID=2917993 RepID=A0A9X2CT50_9BACI|nr:sulfite oxidase [Halalkalibacter alkaliphilus]MCL7747524.1 sulfite oxidase [Halalkalibacter alkaliphilus]